MYTVVVTAVCVSVCVDVTRGNGRGYPLVVHYWADLQSVQGFRCYDNIAPEMRDVSEYLYSLYTWLKFAIPVISLELVKLGTTNFGVHMYTDASRPTRANMLAYSRTGCV